MMVPKLNVASVSGFEFCGQDPRCGSQLDNPDSGICGTGTDDNGYLHKNCLRASIEFVSLAASNGF